MTFFVDTSIYTTRISQLEEENSHLRAQYHELVVEILKKQPVLRAQPPEDTVKRHVMSFNASNTRATCSCGTFDHASEDPAEVQTAIMRHHRDSRLGNGRMSWPQKKNILENGESDVENQR